MSLKTKILLALSFLVMPAFVHSDEGFYPLYLLGNAKFYASLGDRAIADNNWSQAVSYFEKAVQLLPKDTDYLTSLGWSYFKTAQYDKALDAFGQVRQLNAHIVDAYTGPGWVSFKRGDFAQAIAHFQEALTVDSNSSDAYAGLGWASFRNKDIDSAKTYLKYALSKGLRSYSGTEPEAHRALGYLYFSQGDYEEAMTHFKIAVRVRPDWNDARVKWGDCLFALKRFPAAIAVYRKALLHEHTAEIYDKLGWSFYYAKPSAFRWAHQRDSQSATLMFDKALALDPNNADAQSGLKTVANQAH